ncbi:MAG: polysaccharide biosynthesis/export family protein [Candidatus Binatia bacterium]
MHTSYPQSRPFLFLKWRTTLILGLILFASCAVHNSPPRLTLPEPSSPEPQANINDVLTTLAARTASSSADYHVGPQDLLLITLYNIPATEVGVTPRTTEALVSQQGVITLPLLGELRVSGLTCTAIEEVLRSRYKMYLHDPQVGVLVKEYHSQKVSVLGSVQHPGVFALTGPNTLIGVLALAGGLDTRASSHVHLSRNGPEGRQNYIIDLQALTTNPSSLNLTVHSGDIVNVPKADMFFVDGAVHKPGSYPLEQAYTLTQALATAGGADNTEAKFDEVTIFRYRGPGEREAIPINLDHVLSGSIGDPPIKANDVIFVATSTPKYFVKHFLGSLGMGLSVPLY